MTVGLLGFALFGSFEIVVRTVLFPEWRDLSPKAIGNNPYFGNFTLPNLNIRRFSPANYDVFNTTNRFGFRDRDAEFDQDLNQTWVFGDSNTFGMGVEDNLVFTALLDKIGLPTANLAGLGGDLSRDNRILDKLTELGYRPKTVLAVLSMNEHLQEYGTVAPPPPGGEPESEPAEFNAELPADRLMNKIGNLLRPRVFSFLGLKSLLLRNIASYGYIKTHLVSIPITRDWLRSKGFVQDVDLVNRGPAELVKINRREHVDGLAQSTADRLLAMKNKVARAFGSRFAVVLLPTHHHLYPVRFATYLKTFGLDPKTHDAAQPYVLFTKALHERGITTIDALDALRATGDPQLIFYNDAHFNATGHKLIADALGAWISH